MRPFYSIFIIFLFACSSTQKYKNVLSGEFSWEEWKQKAGINQYIEHTYTPDPEKIEYLITLYNRVPSVRFIIFATSYCDDCKDNLPIIFKIFDKAKIPNDRIKLFGLDEEYEEPTGTYKNFDIETAPCLFVLNNGKTIGSVKGPKYNWLEGLINILEKNVKQ